MILNLNLIIVFISAKEVKTIQHFAIPEIHYYVHSFETANTFVFISTGLPNKLSTKAKSISSLRAVF